MSLINAAANTPHGLPFLVRPWHLGDDWMEYVVGTCQGLWKQEGDAYEILSFYNNKPGNGHFEDVMVWFEFSCKRDHKNLIIREVWNKRLKQHLITKRGFTVLEGNHLIKSF